MLSPTFGFGDSDDTYITAPTEPDQLDFRDLRFACAYLHGVLCFTTARSLALPYAVLFSVSRPLPRGFGAASQPSDTPPE